MSDWNYIVFAASPHDDISISAAKEYALENGFTNETARIRDINNCTCVIIKDTNEWLMAKLK